MKFISPRSWSQGNLNSTEIRWNRHLKHWGPTSCSGLLTWNKISRIDTLYTYHGPLKKWNYLKKWLSNVFKCVRFWPKNEQKFICRDACHKSVFSPKPIKWKRKGIFRKFLLVVVDKRWGYSKNTFPPTWTSSGDSGGAAKIPLFQTKFQLFKLWKLLS